MDPAWVIDSAHLNWLVERCEEAGGQIHRLDDSGYLPSGLTKQMAELFLKCRGNVMGRQRRDQPHIDAIAEQQKTPETGVRK